MSKPTPHKPQAAPQVHPAVAGLARLQNHLFRYTDGCRDRLEHKCPTARLSGYSFRARRLSQLFEEYIVARSLPPELRELIDRTLLELEHLSLPGDVHRFTLSPPTSSDNTCAHEEGADL